MKLKIVYLFTLTSLLVQISHAQNNLNLAIATKSVGAKNIELFVIGYDRKNSKTIPRSILLDLTQYGFRGNNIQLFEPKFLIIKGKSGVLDVRFFDSERFICANTVKMIGDENSPQQITFNFVKERHHPFSRHPRHQISKAACRSDKTADLPEQIFDVRNPVGGIRKRFLFKVSLLLSRMFNFAVPSTIINLTEDYLSRRLNDREAHDLKTIINFAIGEYQYDSPVIRQEFSKAGLNQNDLRKISDALEIEFHRQGSLNGALLSKSDYPKFSEMHRNMQGEIHAKNFAKIINEANSNRLVVWPMTPYFLAIFISKKIESKLRVEAALHEKSIGFSAPYFVSQIAPIPDSEFLNLEATPGDLIPLGVFAMGETRGPMLMADFHNQANVTLRERFSNLYNVATTLGFSWMDFGPASISAQLTDNVIRFVDKKRGNALFEYRPRAAGELNAILASGLIRDPEMETSMQNDINAMARYIGMPNDGNVAIDQLLEYNLAQEEAFSHGALWRSKFIQQTRFLNALNKFDWVKYEKIDNEELEKQQDAINKRIGNTTTSTQSHSASSSDMAEKLHKNPVIMFLIDGLGRDRLQYAIESGFMPYTQNLFFERGLVFKSFVQRSLTLPSWSTLFTGHEQDEHGLRGNAPVKRPRYDNDTEDLITNFEDVRLDFTTRLSQGRARAHLAESKLPWIYDFYSDDEIVTSFMPINPEWTFPPIVKFLRSFPKSIQHAFFGTFKTLHVLDQATAEYTVRQINSNEDINLVVNWYGQVDDHYHYSNSVSDKLIFNNIDNNIKSVIEAAKKDPKLKNAYIIVTSDHGHVGGHEPHNEEREYYQEKHNIHNTAFHLSYFLTGDTISGCYDSNKTPHISEHNLCHNMRFVVGSPESPRPDNDLHYLKEFLIQPFQYVYRGKQNTQGPVTAVIDPVGDRLAQIYIRPMSNQGWQGSERMNYSDLSNYQLTPEDPVINLPMQFMGYTMLNLAVVQTDRSVENKIKKGLRNTSGNRPVEFFAMALPGQNSQRSIQELTGSRSFTREPVLVQKFNGHKLKSALILTRDGENGQTFFRYVVIKNFKQSPSGFVTGIISFDPKDDPIGYLATIKETHDTQFRTDREWIILTHNHKYPTMLFALPRQLTLATNLNNNEKRKREIPDFIIVANSGFNFNSGSSLQSDHGGYHRSEVENVFMLSGLGINSIKTPKHIESPIFQRDILPTVLDLGQRGPHKSSGQSLISIIKSLQK